METLYQAVYQPGRNGLINTASESLRADGRGADHCGTSAAGPATCRQR